MLTVRIKVEIGNTVEKNLCEYVYRDGSPVDVALKLLEEAGLFIKSKEESINEEHAQQIEKDIVWAEKKKKEEFIKNNLLPSAKKNILEVIRKYWRAISLTDFFTMYDFYRDPKNLIPTLGKDIYILISNFQFRGDSYSFHYSLENVKIPILIRCYNEFLNTDIIKYIDNCHVFKKFKELMDIMETNNLSYDDLNSKSIREQYSLDDSYVIKRIIEFKNSKLSTRNNKNKAIKREDILNSFSLKKDYFWNKKDNEIIDFLDGKSSDPLSFSAKAQLWAARNGLYLEYFVHSKETDILFAVIDHNFGLNILKNSNNKSVIKYLKEKVLNSTEDYCL